MTSIIQSVSKSLFLSKLKEKKTIHDLLVNTFKSKLKILWQLARLFLIKLHRQIDFEEKTSCDLSQESENYAEFGKFSKLCKK